MRKSEEQLTTTDMQSDVPNQEVTFDKTSKRQLLQMESLDKGEPNNKISESREFWNDFIAQHYDIENKRATVAS